MATRKNQPEGTGRSRSSARPPQAAHGPQRARTGTRSRDSADGADDRREQILRAAIAEFSQHGLAGARTDAIADAAGVNKALLYYYFRNKAGLYAAALDSVAAQMLASSLQSLEHEGSAGERLLRTALNHFDRIAAQPEYRQLMSQEMARLRESGQGSGPAPFEQIFSTLMGKMRQVLDEGMKSGELLRTDWLQVIYAVLGANVFYFLSAPMMRLVARLDPLGQRQIGERRKAALRFLGTVLFADRQRGEHLARRVLADTPMPAIPQPWQSHTTGAKSR